MNICILKVQLSATVFQLLVCFGASSIRAFIFSTFCFFVLCSFIYYCWLIDIITVHLRTKTNVNMPLLETYQTQLPIENKQ